MVRHWLPVCPVTVRWLELAPGRKPRLSSVCCCGARVWLWLIRSLMVTCASGGWDQAAAPLLWCGCRARVVKERLGRDESRTCRTFCQLEAKLLVNVGTIVCSESGSTCISVWGVYRKSCDHTLMEFMVSVRELEAPLSSLVWLLVTVKYHNTITFHLMEEAQSYQDCDRRTVKEVFDIC